MISALIAGTAGTMNAGQPDTPSSMDGKKEKKFEYSNERFADADAPLQSGGI